MIKINFINNWFKGQFEIIAFAIIVLLFISLISLQLPLVESNSNHTNNSVNQLFNLFYVNTSKAHEIAMLIDNKIMKTIEREHISEEMIKSNTSFVFGKKDNWSSEIGYSTEDSTKKRVYENFDVKTTKSIMLRKIYETTQQTKETQTKLTEGDLTIFENVTLQQMNTDDTVMILNVLQDSKISNQSNDSLEINLNKMLDKMLDDFTIDYTFSTNESDKKNSRYIIQLPYKSTDNFENGYHHNDLQLGKLSLIGIYRGEIDFSNLENISSKFLELMSNSYNQESQNSTEIQSDMKLSDDCSSPKDIQLEFQHKKLKEKLHLVDIIAIIQELNIGRKVEHE